MNLPITFKEYVTLRIKSDIATASLKIPAEHRMEWVDRAFLVLDAGEALHAGMDDGTDGTQVPYEVWDAEHGESLHALMQNGFRQMGLE